EIANGKIKRLSLVQRPAQKLSGRGVWPMKTEVALWSGGKVSKTVPVEIRAGTTVVASVAGLPAPYFVFANLNDYAYGLVLLDAPSVKWLEPHAGEVTDPVLRGMRWGAMWDLVRDARRAPRRFIATAVREPPAERDEQIAAGIVGRASRAVSSYLSDEQEAE